MPIDRSKPCEWRSWNGRMDAFDTDCTGFSNMPYFTPELPLVCPRCGRGTDVWNHNYAGVPLKRSASE
jgi:hypothetical protein